GTTLSLTILLLLLPFPLAGLLLALTPPPYLNGLIGACALLQALTLLITFLRLRNDPALRARTSPTRHKA
ncbi:MFS transporter, partial [Streptomyces viridosporus]